MTCLVRRDLAEVETLDLVSLDESGLHTRMTHSNACAPRMARPPSGEVPAWC